MLRLEHTLSKAQPLYSNSLVFFAMYWHPLALWMYPKKVDKCVRIRDKKKQKGKTHMSNKNSPTKYSEEFKKTIVTLYQSGKTYGFYNNCSIFHSTRYLPSNVSNYPVVLDIFYDL